MKKRLATTVCALGLLLSAGIASAGTSPISYEAELPTLAEDIDLATGKKDTNSRTMVENFVTGGHYTANMRIVDADRKRVSATATRVGNNDIRHFRLDQSAVGKDIILVAFNSRVTFVKVDIKGNFYPDF